MFLRPIIIELSEIRAKDMVERIEDFLKPNDHILDVGSGTCHITKHLLDKNYKVIPLDISNQSLVTNLNPIIYNGEQIPFENDSFDVSLILTVLHHATAPLKIIEEAKRVSKRIVIMEDLYINIIHKYATYFIDSLANLDFFNHPHNNLCDAEWRRTFEELGLIIKEARYRRSLFLLWQCTYLIEK